MKFQVGQLVVHCTYGLGEVIGIEQRTISGREKRYYAISVNGMTVWVPADEHVETRLRPPTSPAGFKDLFAILTGTGETLPQDRQERKLLLHEKLQDGKAASLCRVLRDLATFQQARKGNDNDQNLARRVREALLGEWSHALSVPIKEAEVELRRMLAEGTSQEAVKP